MTNLELVSLVMRSSPEWAVLALESLGFFKYERGAMWCLDFDDVHLQAFPNDDSEYKGMSCNECCQIHRPFYLALACHDCGPAWEKLNERHADHL